MIGWSDSDWFSQKALRFHWRTNFFTGDVNFMENATAMKSWISDECSTIVSVLMMCWTEQINAMANRATGKGYENETFYTNIKFQFWGIDNIHVMRASLQKLVEGSSLICVCNSLHRGTKVMSSPLSVCLSVLGYSKVRDGLWWYFLRGSACPSDQSVRFWWQPASRPRARNFLMNIYTFNLYIDCGP